jgi:membrane protease YdiL (CAAX protease family)
MGIGIQAGTRKPKSSVNVVDAIIVFGIAYYSLGYRYVAPLFGRLTFPYADGFENHAWMLVVPLFWLLVLRRGFPVGTLRWRELRAWLWPFLATMGASLSALLWAYFAFSHADLRGMADSSVGAFLFQGTMSGLGEEFLFRGVVQTGLNRSFPLRIGTRTANVGVGTVATSVLFGGLHLMNIGSGEPVNIAIIVASFGCLVGLGLGIGYERTGNLWGAVITHNIANVVNTLLLGII